MFISFRGEIGSGKTTAASHLCLKHDFYRVSFADPLKDQVFDFLWESSTGSSQDLIWTRFRVQTGERGMFPSPFYDFLGTELVEIDHNQKLQWVNERKAKLRPLLQWWGTEYRRAENENYWVDKAEAYMRKLLTEGKSICMDDARFDNEFELIAALGGKQIFIDCPMAEQRAIERSGGGAVGIKGHASEALLDPNDPRNDGIVMNDTSFDEFLHKIDYLVQLVKQDSLYLLIRQPL
jgi:hypothetical protein